MPDPDDRTIEGLCRPLSAKVMPRGAMHNIGGREMDHGRALMSQRKRGRSKPATKPKDSKDA